MLDLLHILCRRLSPEVLIHPLQQDVPGLPPETWIDMSVASKVNAEVVLGVEPLVDLLSGEVRDLFTVVVVPGALTSHVGEEVPWSNEGVQEVLVEGQWLHGVTREGVQQPVWEVRLQSGAGAGADILLPPDGSPCRARHVGDHHREPLVQRACRSMQA